MKFIIVFILLLLLSDISVTAQSNQLKELLSSVKKDPEIELIRSAIDSSICLLRQDYTLSDKNGKQYGRNNNVFFGRKYAIGVLTTNGIYTVYDFMSPWKDDNNYDKYRTSDTLRPRLSITQYRHIGDRKYQSLESHIASRSTDSLFAILALGDSVSGMPNAVGKPDTTGWLVMINNNSYKGSIDTASINLNIVKPRITLTVDKGKMYISHPVLKEPPFGGIYFTTRISMGKIVFFAAGILKKDVKGWYIQSFNATHHTKAKQLPIDSEKLNPVNSKSEKSDNQSELEF